MSAVLRVQRRMSGATGAATVLVVGIAAAAVLLGAGVVVMAGASAEATRASNAADLAALAGSDVARGDRLPRRSVCGGSQGRSRKRGHHDFLHGAGRRRRHDRGQRPRHGAGQCRRVAAAASGHGHVLGGPAAVAKTSDQGTYDQVIAALRILAYQGPSLGRSLVDSIVGSRHKNMNELRPGSTGRTEIRILFVFDPARRAVLLLGGDKAGKWNRWYRRNVPKAE
jgi:hypothetical protein